MIHNFIKTILGQGGFPVFRAGAGERDERNLRIFGTSKVPLLSDAVLFYEGRADCQKLGIPSDHRNKTCS